MNYTRHDSLTRLLDKVQPWRGVPQTAMRRLPAPPTNIDLMDTIIEDDERETMIQLREAQEQLATAMSTQRKVQTQCAKLAEDVIILKQERDRAIEQAVLSGCEITAARKVTESLEAENAELFNDLERARQVGEKFLGRATNAEKSRDSALAKVAQLEKARDSALDLANKASEENAITAVHRDAALQKINFIQKAMENAYRQSSARITHLETTLKASQDKLVASSREKRQLLDDASKWTTAFPDVTTPAELVARIGALTHRVETLSLEKNELQDTLGLFREQLQSRLTDQYALLSANEALVKELDSQKSSRQVISHSKDRAEAAVRFLVNRNRELHRQNHRLGSLLMRKRLRFQAVVKKGGQHYYQLLNRCNDVVRKYEQLKAESDKMDQAHRCLQLQVLRERLDRAQSQSIEQASSTATIPSGPDQPPFQAISADALPTAAESRANIILFLDRLRAARTEMTTTMPAPDFQDSDLPASIVYSSNASSHRTPVVDPVSAVAINGTSSQSEDETDFIATPTTFPVASQPWSPIDTPADIPKTPTPPVSSLPESTPTMHSVVMPEDVPEQEARSEIPEVERTRRRRSRANNASRGRDPRVKLSSAWIIFWSIPDWLKAMRLHKWEPMIRRFDWNELLIFDDVDFETIGISNSGARNAFVKRCTEVRDDPGFEERWLDMISMEVFTDRRIEPMPLKLYPTVLDAVEEEVGDQP